jgi:hypothetical protein
MIELAGIVGPRRSGDTDWQQRSAIQTAAVKIELDTVLNDGLGRNDPLRCIYLK